MKEYRLKKWYPTLPEDWEVGMKVGQGNGYFLTRYSPCSSKYTNTFETIDIVRNNPEFWEEVVDEVVADVVADKPLIISEDGFELFDGDVCYMVYKTSMTSFNKTIMREGLIPNPSYRLIFSSKENAINFITMNAPILSLNHLLSVWGPGTPDSYKQSPLFKKFKELVENQIK